MLREQLMMFSKTTPAVLTTFLVGISLGGSALACSMDGWDSNSGAVGVGSPFGATPPDLNGIARVEEFCALQATGQGHVQTNSPSHSEVTNRVYLFPNLSGSGEADVLVGYSDDAATAELFSIAFDGTNWVISTTGGDSTSIAVSVGWNLFEYHVNFGTNTMDIWVNADATMEAPTATLANVGGAATLESVRLGLPNGLGGFSGGEVLADSFQMNNTTAIGPVLVGDADGDGDVDIFDYFPVRDELLMTLAPGYPDCDLDGDVDIFEYFCIRDIILAP
jgi:hypothetical protein